jgi:hypothetical protein
MAFVFGMQLEELNMLEDLFLDILDFDLHVSEDEFEVFQKGLVDYYLINSDDINLE